VKFPSYIFMVGSKAARALVILLFLFGVWTSISAKPLNAATVPNCAIRITAISSGNFEHNELQLKALTKFASFHMPEDNAILAKRQDMLLIFTNDGDQVSEVS
jgi:hypothetical protein